MAKEKKEENGSETTEETKTLPNQVSRKENYDYERKFTREELEEKSKQLVRAVREKAALEDQKKSAMSGFKSKIDSKTAELNLVSDQINTGSEYVTHTCDALLDYEKGTKTFFYNGEIVGEEKLTAADHQLRAGDFDKTFDETVKEKTEEIIQTEIPLDEKQEKEEEAN